MTALADTLEILGNQDTVRQIKESVEDIKHERTKEINSIKDVIREFLN